MIGRLSTEPTSDLVDSCIATRLGEGIGEGNIFRADIDTVLTVAAIGDAANP